jgi:hypothetical protein
MVMTITTVSQMAIYIAVVLIQRSTGNICVTCVIRFTWWWGVIILSDNCSHVWCKVSKYSCHINQLPCTKILPTAVSGQRYKSQFK